MENNEDINISPLPSASRPEPTLKELLDGTPESIKLVASKMLDELSTQGYVATPDPVQTFVDGFCMADSANSMAKTYMLAMIDRLSDENRTKRQRFKDVLEARELLVKISSPKK